MLEESMTDKENYLQNMPKVLADWKTRACIYDGEKNPCAKIFISDGIICPNIWFEQDVRPLFVLKEPYGDKEEDRTTWLNGTYSGKVYSATYKKLLEWSAVLFGEPSPQEYRWNDDLFKKIAIINIKKYGGYKRSQNIDLQKHAETHSSLIYRQIELIKPNIIICGYTGWLLDIVWEESSELKEKIRQNKIQGRVYNVPGMKNVKLIDFWHPSAWATKTDLVAAFKNDVDVAKGNCKNKKEPNESNDDK